MCVSSSIFENKVLFKVYQGCNIYFLTQLFNDVFLKWLLQHFFISSFLLAHIHPSSRMLLWTRSEFMKVMGRVIKQRATFDR